MVAITPFLAAASGLVGLAQASPLEVRAVDYKTYRGDGTVSQGWPSESQWASFETM